MNNKFDELTKQMAQSVTRRAALKRFGIGLVGMVLGWFSLENRAVAGTVCVTDSDCGSTGVCCSGMYNPVPKWCDRSVDLCCCKAGKTAIPICSGFYYSCVTACANAHPHK
jgi:hypothetical protein